MSCLTPDSAPAAASCEITSGCLARSIFSNTRVAFRGTITTSEHMCPIERLFGKPIVGLTRTLDPSMTVLNRARAWGRKKGSIMNMPVLSAMLIGAGRLVPTVAAMVGLIGVVLGGLALSRSTRRTSAGIGRLGAIAAGVAGLISAVVGGLHSANSAGGFGTGNGLAGAIVAIVLGLISMVLGGFALARTRRREPDSHLGR